jgi:polyketide cyclase/dehydrase/lipid transport protein
MRESVSTRVQAAPDVVFARVTDVARLPEWNHAITEVVDSPAHLVPGSVWKVRLHALGQSWVSRSTLVDLDERGRRFRYRSQSDDGNPSYADWEWQIVPDGTGTKVTVAVELHPQTFWRKYLLVHLRRPTLRKEMRASLRALSATVPA